MIDHDDAPRDYLPAILEKLESIERKVDKLERNLYKLSEKHKRSPFADALNKMQNGHEECYGSGQVVLLPDDNDDMAIRTPKEQCEHEPNPNTLTCNKCGAFLR